MEADVDDSEIFSTALIWCANADDISKPSPVVGKKAMILCKTEMTINVTPFSDEFDMMPEVPVVHTEVEYDCPITGDSKILNHQKCAIHQRDGT